MSQPLLRVIEASELARLRSYSLDATTIAEAAAIIAESRAGGAAGVRGVAERFKDIAPGDSLLLDKAALKAAYERIPQGEREVLERTKKRIELFAQAQRNAIEDISLPIAGGTAGHTVTSLKRAGCYAPGGRFPLPSSVLMTAVTARAAGVSEVVVASPRPTDVTLAAAHVAGADAFLPIGGAQAVAVLAYGCEVIAPVDIIVGPGNRWVTAAKKLVYGDVLIDMLAGPSELLVIADSSADPSVVAADLLAQAEHDVDAVPMLIAMDRALVVAVNEELETQLAVLSTATTARAALKNGFAILVQTTDDAVRLSDLIAPEHLELLTDDAESLVPRLRNYGAVFVGSASAEVMGDYGAGPNHVLPTAGTARWSGGLSVFNFLKINTWLKLEGGSELRELVTDSMTLAQLEGLEAHSRSAAKRKR